MTWSPGQYGRFADDRGRPFFDLVSRVGAERPRRVVDLGCGPGTLTAALARRWPEAEVVGVDSSPEMIAAAEAAATAATAGGRPRFELGEIEAWEPPADVDVVVTNAALQWVPSHRDCLRRWVAALPSGAWLAWQVPGNFAAPSHALLHQLAESERWAPRLADVVGFDRSVGSPEEYAALLLEAGWSADAWETTYLHVLEGEDAVLEWTRGTALGPIRAALAPEELAAFEREYATLLRAAYPRRPYGTLFPFRRIFAVGQKP